MQQESSNGSATATLTDEQILGLEPVPAASRAHGGPNDVSVAQAFPHATEVASGGPEEVAGAAASENPRVPRPADKNGAPGRPELQNQETADPAWLTALEAQPEGGREAAAEARQWRDTAR